MMTYILHEDRDDVGDVYDLTFSSWGEKDENEDERDELEDEHI